MIVKKGTWVLICEIVLMPSDRAENLPEETKSTPLKKWVKGFLKSDAHIGDLVEVTTVTNRTERGFLHEVEPHYTISFGNYIPETAKIGIEARKVLSEVENG